MINQATFKFYQVILDNESGSEMQLLALVEEYCFEAVSAERRHTCYKKLHIYGSVSEKMKSGYIYKKL